MRCIFTVLLILAALTKSVLIASAATSDKPVIHFGVIPRYNPLVMYKRYQPIMDYLSAETPYRFELKISKDYPEAVRFLQRGVPPLPEGLPLQRNRCGQGQSGLFGH